MAEEDKEPKQPEEQQNAEQQPTDGATEEAKDEAPNPKKGDDKGSKSSSAHKDDCTYCTCTIQERFYLFKSPLLRETPADTMTILKPPGSPLSRLIRQRGR